MRSVFLFVLSFMALVTMRALVACAEDTESIWLLNGSITRLHVHGSNWRFLYEAPRPGMQRENVRNGTTAFNGFWNGALLSGTAYVYSRQCGAQGYSVSGSMSSDGMTLDLTGYAPYVDPEDHCKFAGNHLVINHFEFRQNIVAPSPVDITAPVEDAKQQGRAEAAQRVGDLELSVSSLQQIRLSLEQSLSGERASFAKERQRLEMALSERQSQVIQAQEDQKMSAENVSRYQEEARKANEDKCAAEKRVRQLEDALDYMRYVPGTPAIIIPAISFLLSYERKDGRKTIRITLIEIGIDTIILVAGATPIIFKLGIVPRLGVSAENVGLTISIFVFLANLVLKLLSRRSINILMHLDYELVPS